MSKIIGKGAYGCVYSPPLKCKDDECPSSNPKCVNGVSKLSSRTTSINERNLTSSIDFIDLRQVYHIGNPTYCKPEDTFVNNCNVSGIINLQNEDLRLLIFNHGGERFDNVIEKHRINIDKFINGFKNIFFAVKDMSEHGFVHSDIKGDNILIDDKYNFKLIDFGLSWTDIPKIQAKHNYWPPEYPLLGSEHDNEEYDVIIDFIDKDLKLLNHDELEKLLEQKFSDDFINTLHKLSGEEIFKIIKSKVDLYSIGVMIAELYYTSINSTVLNFIMSPPMIKLVERMTDEDFFKRITPQEAYDRYSIISKKIY